MIKSFLLVVFFLVGSYPSMAAESVGGDQDFINELDSVKNPFEDGFPKAKPVEKPIVQKPRHHQESRPVTVSAPVVRSQPIQEREITLPALKVEGVIVGEDIHQAIINDQVVGLEGDIDGAKVNAVSREGVELLFQGKKFFLKVD